MPVAPSSELTEIAHPTKEVTEGRMHFPLNRSTISLLLALALLAASKTNPRQSDAAETIDPGTDAHSSQVFSHA